MVILEQGDKVRSPQPPASNSSHDQMMACSKSYCIEGVFLKDIRPRPLVVADGLDSNGQQRAYKKYLLLPHLLQLSVAVEKTVKYPKKPKPFINQVNKHAERQSLRVQQSKSIDSLPTKGPQESCPPRQVLPPRPTCQF